MAREKRKSRCRFQTRDARALRTRNGRGALAQNPALPPMPPMPPGPRDSKLLSSMPFSEIKDEEVIHFFEKINNKEKKRNHPAVP